MWRAFRGLVKKEFLQVFRDPNMLRLIFLMPIIQLILFGYVVNTDVKRLALDVYDFDRTSFSRELVEAFQAGEYFVPAEPHTSVLQLEQRFKEGTSEMAIIIPDDFSEKITERKSITVGLLADGSNANSAAIGIGYASRIAQQFSQEQTGFHPPLELRTQVLYNPEGESVYFMVPGIVAILLTMLTIMLTSMGIVREREHGTLEQILVTPITKFTFLAGKVIPFAILGLFEMVVVLIIGIAWFHVPFVGSFWLLFVLAAVYLLAVLGIGLFFSTVTSTQQQAMFFAWFFSIFTILTSGFFTPIANMPHWLQYITYLNPMRYFLSIVRGIMMRGAGIVDLLPDVIAQAVFAVIIFGFAYLRFSKR